MELEKIKKVIAPDFDTRLETKQKLSTNAYYIMILLVSVLAIFIPPLLMGSVKGDVSIAFPKTLEGWILWLILNISSAVANICIFVLFKVQAKKNCKKHDNFIKAEEILDRVQNRKQLYIPRSPKKMNMQDYTTKIVFIVLGTVMSFLTVTSLMLSFDVYSLISTLLSTVITIVMSWFTMLNNEEYWTQEYLMYAKYIEEQMLEESLKTAEKEESIIEGENENVEIRKQRI